MAEKRITGVYAVLSVKRQAEDGRTYILGYRVHLACTEGDVPLAFTVQPLSRNDKFFYKPLLKQVWNMGVRFRVVAADRQCDSMELREWTKAAVWTLHPSL